MSETKKQLYNHCVAFVNARVQLAEEGLRQAQHAANNETKSSAGDKYETGRAMMHLEKEKLSGQLSEALKMKKALDQINSKKTLQEGGLGALVETSTAKYYVSISAGLIELGQEKYFAISPVSPIGQQLIGKKEGEFFSFAGKSQTITVIS